MELFSLPGTRCALSVPVAQAVNRDAFSYSCILLVGAAGFEPAAPFAQGSCATRLRYAPTLEILNFTAVSRSSPVRVLAFLAKIVAELSQTQFTVPELPIHHPTCPKTPIRWPHD